MVLGKSWQTCRQPCAAEGHYWVTEPQQTCLKVKRIRLQEKKRGWWLLGTLTQRCSHEHPILSDQSWKKCFFFWVVCLRLCNSTFWCFTQPIRLVRDFCLRSSSVYKPVYVTTNMNCIREWWAKNPGNKFLPFRSHLPSNPPGDSLRVIKSDNNKQGTFPIKHCCCHKSWNVWWFRLTRLIWLQASWSNWHKMWLWKKD